MFSIKNKKKEKKVAKFSDEVFFFGNQITKRLSINLPSFVHDDEVSI